MLKLNSVAWNYLSEMKTPQLLLREVWIRWKPPELTRLKINIDGDARGTPRLAGVGYVIRDHQGRWLIGASQNLGIATTSAELWGVY